MKAQILAFPARAPRHEADAFKPVPPGARQADKKTSLAEAAHACPPLERGTKSQEQRKAMLAKLHIGLVQLYARLPGFNRDTYEGVLVERYGRRSAANLSHDELHDLLLHFQALGFEAARGSARRRPGRGKAERKQIPALLGQPGDPRYGLIRQIEALLAEKGRAEGRHVSWGYAAAILKRQSGGMVKHCDLATAEQLRKLAIALRMDARRKGRFGP